MKKFFSAALVTLLAIPAFAVPVFSVDNEEASSALSNIERKVDVVQQANLEVYLIETNASPAAVYLVMVSPGKKLNHFTAFRLDSIEGYKSHRLFEESTLKIVGLTPVDEKEARGSYRELMVDFSSAVATLADASRSADQDKGKEQGQDKEKGDDKEQSDAMVAAEVDVVVVEK